MPKISSLSTSTNLQSTDILVGTDVSDSNKSKNFTLGDLASFVNTTPNGTGTTAFVPRFSSSTTVEDSIIYASTTGVGINNASPQAALHINGKVQLTPASSNEITSITAQGNIDSNDGLYLGRTADSAVVVVGGNTSETFVRSHLNSLVMKTVRDSDHFKVKVGLLEKELITVRADSPNTGINNTNPQYTLDVGGNINSNKLVLTPVASVDTASIEYSFNTDRLYLTPQNNDSVMVGSETTNADLIVKGDTKSETYSVSSLNTAPASASATGTVGDIRFTANHIYLCVASNTWKRVAIATF